MLRSTAILVLAALTLAGCGSETPEAGVLVVEERLDSSGGFYIEGAVSFVSVRAEDGTRVLRGRLEERARRELAAGAYELRAWQRPCNGNCGLLDPPTGHCSGPVEVRPDSTTTVVVTFRASEPCTISAS